jgi:isoquinoline 1-oxidoreductase
MGTFGSRSTRFFGPLLRAAGAQAKKILLTIASEELNLPQEKLNVEDGVVFSRENKDIRITYGQLARGKKIVYHLEDAIEVKKQDEFKIMGIPYTRRDALEKVTGEAQYAGDIRLPGMLYACLVRPATHGAHLLNADLSEAEKIEGLQIIKEGETIAMLHPNPDVAKKAATQIKPRYDEPKLDLNEMNIFDHLLKVAPEGDDVARQGNIKTGESTVGKVLGHTYLDGYVAHAPIETHTALVKIEGNKATVWASTQTPFRAKEEVAEVLGIAEENVRVITPFVGGGFGGKTSNGQVKQAAALAKKTGKPVQVAWSREDEFFYDAFRPAAVVKIRAGNTKEGKIGFWDYGVYFAGQRGSEHFYDIPHHKTTAYGSGWGGTPGSHPFATGAWRAPANNTNTFARESQIDILAADAGVDPLEFRLNHLKDQRMLNVLKAAGDKFRWQNRKRQDGIGSGIACGIDAGTYVATIAEVKVNKESGKVKVERVVCAQDMGQVINPAGATIQMEGCITMGLGYALSEEIHFRGGEILDLNYDTYEIPRFSWLPEIETVLVENRTLSPQGGGEPAIITMGGAIANAIYDAVGVRIFQLPMTKKRIKKAIAEA